MGKKKATGGLGKSIIRDRFGKQRRTGPETHLHTSELGDGCDWNRINLRSVTEETSLDEFLATAELAGTEFIAERLNVKFVSEESRAGLLSAEDVQKVRQTQDQHKDLLRIPRRPHWEKGISAEELDRNERESFLEWRRQLAELQDVEGIVMTPFERNLDFWRQLWRVTERSDIVVQIVDGRNPLMFRCKDLEKYVKEVDANKLNMVLVNKADFLSQKQREMWASYFDDEGLLVAFWSASLEKERLEEEKKQQEAEEEEEEEEEEEQSSSEESVDDEEKDEGSEKDDSHVDESADAAPVHSNTHVQKTDTIVQSATESVCDGCERVREGPSGSVTGDGCVSATDPRDITHRVEQLDTSDDICTDTCKTTLPATEPDSSTTTPDLGTCGSQDDSTSDNIQNKSETVAGSTIRNNPNILNGLELIELLRSLHTGRKHTDNVSTIGLVGYPNVGKSSTINALLQTKKVPVSATPGRTKHFQTLFLDQSLMLCDCPGLVMPSFVNTKAEMVLNGILPIDQMRDYVAPVALLATLIPRRVLESIYGIMIPKPMEGEDENRPPTAHELLSAYGYMRGFMTHKGIPDFQRSSRHILKDFVNGKLLYCTPSPGADIEEFCPTPSPSKPVKDRSHLQPAPVGSRYRVANTYRNEVDQMFFEKMSPAMGTKGVSTSCSRQEGPVEQYDSNAPLPPTSLSASQQSLTGKPWKKHHNRGKKEKLRRLHSYLDA